MDLTGHHSNPSTGLEALLDLVGSAPNELNRDERGATRRKVERSKSPIGSRHRRYDWVQDAVIDVLERCGEPMQAREVHAAVEALLARPVRWGVR